MNTLEDLQQEIINLKNEFEMEIRDLKYDIDELKREIDNLKNPNQHLCDC